MMNMWIEEVTRFDAIEDAQARADFFRTMSDGARNLSIYQRGTRNANDKTLTAAYRKACRAMARDAKAVYEALLNA